jgi:esterase/lipase
MCAAGCATLPPRLQESGMNSRFSFGKDTPFDEYIRKSMQMIEKTRVDINEINRDAILNANAPFELKPDEDAYPRNKSGRYEKGILLMHGLSDSPYHMQPVARHFQKRGFLVRGMLLPGHGTVPGDLLQVTYADWIRAVEYGVHQMKPHVEDLYLGGFSTGGALCVLISLNDEEIKGLVLFAPAVGIRSPWAFMADFLKIFTKWLGDKGDDKDYAKYESFAVNGGAQLYRLTRRIDADFAAGKRLAAPVFVVSSADDISADSDKMARVFKAYATSQKSVFILYGRGAAIDTKDADRRIVYKNSYFSEDRIIDFSHPSLLIPPDDPHYGINGGYKYCLHYQGNREKRMACLHDPNIWKGEITKENLANYTLRRLTYNPRYDEMMEAVDRFMDDARKPPVP